MSKIYLYNCNYQNEFLDELDTDHPEEWLGCSTDVPPVESNIPGTSYAFNPETNAWDILIDDWRGVTLYKKSDSRITIEGLVGKKNPDYIELQPEDTSTQYIWNEGSGTWLKYIEPINPAAIIKQYEEAIQRHIDKVAQERGYDNGYTCASYFDDKNARYASDARIFKDWRSDVWVAVNQILNSYAAAIEQVEEGGAMPTNVPSIDQIIASLPIIEWEEL